MHTHSHSHSHLDLHILRFTRDQANALNGHKSLLSTGTRTHTRVLPLSLSLSPGLFLPFALTYTQYTETSKTCARFKLLSENQ